jgi:hypothetical protein
MNGDRNEMQVKPVKEFHVDKLKGQGYSNRASILRKHEQAILFLDINSAARLKRLKYNN